MAAKRASIHGQWSSRWAFILAATGSAVGLGNIWRFPYVAGENGGGAFVLLYLVCILLVGIPILMSEVLLGRRGRQSPINTMQSLAEEEGRSQFWQIIGWMGMLTGFLILSYYSVIAGWTLAYIFRAGTGMFSGTDAEQIALVFEAFIGDPEKLLAWHTVFMMMTIIVVSRGVKSGLEQAVRYLMPALFLLLLLMVGYAMNTEKFMDGLKYLFVPDFTVFREDFRKVLLSALGQAFFSLSLGMGALIMYGSYLSDKASIPNTAATIAFADCLVAILAGVAIFPIIFTYGMEPAAGPGLIFVALPVAFGQMPGGTVFGTLFFFLLMFAAWTSAISLLEPPVAWLVESRGLSRIKAAACAGFAAWLLGVCTVLSFNEWAFSFHFIGEEKTNGLFDMIDLLTASIMLPLGGILIAIFTAWAMSQTSSFNELQQGMGFYKVWRFTVRFIAPTGVILIFLQALGLL